MQFSEIVNLDKFPITDLDFQKSCKSMLDKNGALNLEKFLQPAAIKEIREEGIKNQHLAHYVKNDHNVYLMANDPNYPVSHPRNRPISSSKGCIQDDQIPQTSPLHTLYDSEVFKNFLSYVLGEEALYEFADSLSSINLHFASKGQELGWHFDNSSFATTLLIQKPEDGGVFEYVENVRDAIGGEMNYTAVDRILNNTTKPKKFNLPEGTLALFRGQNALHRVTPTEGERTRILAVFAYNSKPGIAISPETSMIFYGRVG